MGELEATVERERAALRAHREVLRGSMPPPSPADAPRGSFVHGFFLPFSLVAATLKDPELRGPYLRLALARSVAVAAVSLLVLATSDDDAAKQPKRGKPSRHGGFGLVVTRDADASAPSVTPIHFHAPGIHVDIEPGGAEKSHASVLGQELPVKDDADEDALDASTKEPPTLFEQLAVRIGHGWARLLATIATLSAVSGVVVALSRRYDDQLSFHASRLAGVLPEDAAPPVAKIALDVRWLVKKLRRRIRGYIVFAAGVPTFLVLLLVPHVGHWLFRMVAVVWAWFWLGVFTAAKSAHAWADEDTAPSPAVVRAVSERVPRAKIAAPLRSYTKLWARLTRGVNAPAAVFERTPAAFLGLALARTLLSLPFAYLFVRPLVPVAAGRLCAEADPQGRFAAGPDGLPRQP